MSKSFTAANGFYCLSMTFTDKIMTVAVKEDGSSYNLSVTLHNGDIEATYMDASLFGNIIAHLVRAGDMKRAFVLLEGEFIKYTVSLDLLGSSVDRSDS